MNLKKLKEQINACTVCKSHLSHGVRPVYSFHSKSKIAIVGQAPGKKVHESGIPWDDKSGDTLREWLGVDKDTFYDEQTFAIVPMGFCYPGKGKSGDLPPRSECAPLWHQSIFDQMHELRLIMLIGQYAQKYYLPDEPPGLTEKVKNYSEYLPEFFVLPHPSPRNNIWQAKHPWFMQDVLPELRENVAFILSDTRL